MEAKQIKERPYPHYKFPNEIIISVRKMNNSEIEWHNVSKNSYELSTINYGWFPTDAIMGVVKGRYEDTNNIGAVISGNMGTANIAVVNIDKAIKLLNDAGYINIEEVN